MNSRRFELPDNRGVVIFSCDVLAHMYQHAQTSLWAKEAGGQLFSATPAEENVDISVITGPYKQDRRTRTSFSPDVNMIILDRQILFLKGHHAVGLWHTHPESWPNPSSVDRETAQAYLHSFNGEMEGFLLAILGNVGSPYNLTVWLASTNPAIAWLKLPEIIMRRAE